MFDTGHFNDTSLIFDESMQYPEFHAFLIFKQKDYIKCISNYFLMSNTIMKRNVFEVIERLLINCNEKFIE